MTTQGEFTRLCVCACVAKMTQKLGLYWCALYTTTKTTMMTTTTTTIIKHN